MLDTVKGDPVGSRPGYYEARHRLVRTEFDALEEAFAGAVPRVVRQAVAAGGRGSMAATTVLDDFTAECVRKVTATLTRLLNELS